jgi:ATP-dependent RNA helicase DeaD
MRFNNNSKSNNKGSGSRSKRNAMRRDYNFKNDNIPELTNIDIPELSGGCIPKPNGISSTLFKELGLDEKILMALKTLKFDTPTSIQEQAIPLALAGKDIIAGSETGSGKTLAFGAGIIQNVQRGGGVQGLILTPTRELAEQVARSLKVFSQNKYLTVSAVFGGVSIIPQMKELKRADIVVATPGRILDHINRKTVKLGKVKTVVLDEADTMLDMGFIRDVEKIIRACPKERQTLLFSATITGEIDSLAKRHTKNPARIFTKSTVDPAKLTQTRYDVSRNLKFPLLVHLLKNEESDLAMVFCNTRRSTDVVAKNLRSQGIAARAIHGGFSQAQRQQAIRHFHSKRVGVLICTDVAARGLDIKGVSHVYNYEVPTESKQYVHRIGRTARAGKEGKAINILSKRDYANFSKVLRDNSLKVTKERLPEFARAGLRSA